MPERVEIQFDFYRRMSEQGLRLGSIDQLVVENTVIERLFAEAIACEDELFLLRVPQGDREHPVDVIHKIVTVDLIKMRNDLNIGLSAKFVPAFFQIGADLAKVVQLAVHH